MTVPSPILGLKSTGEGPIRVKPEVGDFRQLISQSSRNLLHIEEGGFGKGKLVWRSKTSNAVVPGVGAP